MLNGKRDGKVDRSYDTSCDYVTLVYDTCALVHTKHIRTGLCHCLFDFKGSGEHEP
jgi:hypothetical protein